MKPCINIRFKKIEAMFGSRKKEEKNTSTQISTSTNGLNALVKGTKMEGNVNADNDFRVDGEIIGNLNCKGKVIIGTTGKLVGEIRCENAIIEGDFQGKLFVSDVLTVRETAILNGDITTGKLTVQSGAIFNVVCKMGGAKALTGNTENRKLVADGAKA